MKHAREAPNVLSGKEAALLDPDSHRSPSLKNVSHRARRESPIEKHEIVKQAPDAQRGHNESKSERLAFDRKARTKRAAK